MTGPNYKPNPPRIIRTSVKEPDTGKLEISQIAVDMNWAKSSEGQQIRDAMKPHQEMVDRIAALDRQCDDLRAKLAEAQTGPPSKYAPIGSKSQQARIQELEARCERLREALQATFNELKALYPNHTFLPAAKALAETPTESLEAHDREVRREVLKELAKAFSTSEYNHCHSWSAEQVSNWILAAKERP